MPEILLRYITTGLLDGKSWKILLLGVLVLVFVTLIYRGAKLYIQYRKAVFESVRHTLNQAISHQNPDQDLSYALQAHKEQQIKDILEKNSRLLIIDPLKGKIIHYTQELQCVNSFQKSEKITKEFLSNCKSRY